MWREIVKRVNLKVLITRKNKNKNKFSYACWVPPIGLHSEMSALSVCSTGNDFRHLTLRNRDGEENTQSTGSGELESSIASCCWAFWSQKCLLVSVSSSAHKIQKQISSQAPPSTSLDILRSSAADLMSGVYTGIVWPLRKHSHLVLEVLIPHFLFWSRDAWHLSKLDFVSAFSQGAWGGMAWLWGQGHDKQQLSHLFCVWREDPSPDRQQSPRVCLTEDWPNPKHDKICTCN